MIADVILEQVLFGVPVRAQIENRWVKIKTYRQIDGLSSAPAYWALFMPVTVTINKYRQARG